MDTPEVSVIVVSYNTRDLTLQCLRTLEETFTGVPHEVIVVDNASADGSVDAVAAGFPEVRLLPLDVNVGFGRAVNHAAAMASGEYLFLFNTDAEPIGDVLRTLVDFARAHPEHRIYTTRTLTEDGVDDDHSCHGLPSLWSLACFASGASTFFPRSALFNPERLPAVDRSRVAEVPAVSGAAVLIDSALFAELKGFEPRYFMYSEDVDLSARALERGARPVLVPEARVIHQGGGSSGSVRQRVMVLRGKSTYLRLRWSRPRARAGTALLTVGIGARALGARLTGRATYWREVWAERQTWLAGWPEPHN
jgi:GT2 family glycosyltransferase